MTYSQIYREIGRVKESYEQIAIGYNRVRAQPWNECVNFIRSFDAGVLVLDLGCGNGRHMIPSVLHGHETIGVDFSKNMLMIAKKKLESIRGSTVPFHFVLADISHLPFRNNSIDNILYIATLHNLPTRSLRVKSLQEVKRVLKLGGKCLISVWKRIQFRFLLTVVKTYIKKMIRMKGDFEVFLPWKMNGLLVYRYYYLYTAKQLAKDIKETKLCIINFEKVKISTRIISDNYFVTVIKLYGENKNAR